MSSPEPCPNIERCPLFPKLKNQASLQFCLDSYCNADFRSCARYIHVRKTQSMPPADLLPNGKSLTDAH